MARDKLRDDIKRLGHSPGTPNADEFSYHNHLPEENYHALLTRLATWRTGDRPRHPLSDLSLTSPFQAEVHVAIRKGAATSPRPVDARGGFEAKVASPLRHHPQ